MWTFILLMLPDIWHAHGSAVVVPEPQTPHGNIPGWDLPQPIPADWVPPPDWPGPQQPEPEPAPPGNVVPTPGPAQPFGPGAIVQGEDLQVIESNGVVFMPWLDSIILSGTDKDIWPKSLLALPEHVQQHIVTAQETITMSELPCRIRGACTAQGMVQLLHKNAGVQMLTRAQFVAFHLWVTTMARMSGGLSVAQVPTPNTPQAAWAVACLDVATGTVLSAGAPATA